MNRTSKSLRLVLAAIAAVCILTVASAAEPYRLEKAELAARASAAIHAPIVRVVEKPQPSPSGNPNDYVSFARYTWPDPSKTNGLPYVTIDGKVNFELVAKGDHERLFSFIENVQALAAAW